MSSFNTHHLAASVKAYRGKKGQRAAAAELGTSLSTFSRLEQGELVPDVEFFLRVCEWMGTTPREFFLPATSEEQDLGTVEQVARVLHGDASLDPELVEAIITLLTLIYRRPPRRPEEGSSLS
jgi:transcriptional regulator with XRE-family HTH domain